MIRDLTIVLPAYNEALRIEATIEKILAWSEDHLDHLELLVVDDGSSDGTWEKMLALGRALPHLGLIRFRLRPPGHILGFRAPLLAQGLDPCIVVAAATDRLDFAVGRVFHQPAR